jgi:hypothetical protein
MTNRLPAFYLGIIEKAKDGRIPDSLPNEEKETIEAIKQLIGDDYLSGNVTQVYSNVMLSNISVTLKGENTLLEATATHRLLSAIHNVSYGAWKFILVIIAGFIVAVMVKVFIG